MSPFPQDVKFAFRSLRRQPGFTFMIVGMLAVGIAGTTAIFSIFNGLFLRPLPYPDAERLVNLDETAPKWNLEFVSIAYADFDAWRQHSKAFAGMAVWSSGAVNLSGHGGAERVERLRVTHDLLPVLGVQPVIGRGILPEEDKPGGRRVAVLGYGLWQRLYGGKADVLGQILRLDGRDYTIVGVLPPEVIFGRAELWTPLGARPTETNGWYLSGMGRLKPGITIAQAREDLTRIHKGMIPQRDVNGITSPTVLPLRERAVGNFRMATSVLLGAVAVVLLIGCVNIAGLMLARGSARGREMGIRAALGASRRRLVRQLLGESLLLSAVGAIAGVALGYAGLRALIAMMPNQLPRWVRFDMDWRFLAFTVAVSGGAAVLFGLLPALDATRIDLRSALMDATTRSTASTGKKRSLSVLVVGEVALAAILLIVSGLLVQAFRRLQHVDPGFRTENVLMYAVALPSANYEKPEQRTAFFDRLLARTRTLPGVRSAGAITAPPLGGHWGNFFQVENAPPLGPNEQDPVVLQRLATDGYFEAMGIHLREGRFFDEKDGRKDATPVVIVNETFAKRYWPNVSPIGKRIRHRGEGNPWMDVVGVARDIRHYGLETPMRPGVYLPYPMGPSNGMTVVMETAVEPNSLVPAARHALQEIDPDLPMFQIDTMANRMRESIWVRRLYSWLLGVFAVVALALAVAGIYGVISFTVSRRTHEIGIRIALGARRGQVLGEVLRYGILLTAIGGAIGLAAAYAVAGLMKTMLLGVSAADPATYIGVALLLGAVAVIANLLPARKAAAIDPMVALRFE